MTHMISVIIPVYNAEPYLKRCIDSVLSQSWGSFELLLVDDGSSDNSGKICDEYANKDARIKVFHKENGGVSSARNVGLRNACGNWISFVDADDSVEPDYLKNLLGHADETIDLVVSYSKRYLKRGIIKESYPSILIDDSNFEQMFVKNDMHWHTAPWSKLFRTEIIKKNGLMFCEGMHICEDALFVYSYMLLSRSLYISNDTDYCYYSERENTLTKRMNPVESELLTCHQIYVIVIRMIEEKKIKDACALRHLNWLIASNVRRVLDALYHNKTSYAERMNIIKRIDTKIYVHYIGKRSWKEELLKLLLRHRCFCLYDGVREMVVLYRHRNQN